MYCLFWICSGNYSCTVGFINNTIEREFHGGYMTSKELFKAKEILKENNISASPIEFWETEKYYQIAYITYAGNFFIDRFNK